MSVGAGIAQGGLSFDSSSVIVEADIGDVPAAWLGVTLWPTEAAGIDLRYQIGMFGAIAVPLEVESGQDDLEFFVHQLQGAFVYRWFLGPRADSSSIALRTGFILHNLTPSDHTPSVVLATTYFGPEVGTTFRLPLGGGSFGVDLEASGLFPFFVRESPDRSGDPEAALGYRARLAPWVKLSTHLYLALSAEVTGFRVNFEGEGNRALGGVIGGENADDFRRAQLIVDWIF